MIALGGFGLVVLRGVCLVGLVCQGCVVGVLLLLFGWFVWFAFVRVDYVWLVLVGWVGLVVLRLFGWFGWFAFGWFG